MSENVSPRRRIQDGPVEPARLLDDVYYIGRVVVGVFVVRTSEGLVLIDSMDPVDADERHILPGLRALGLENEKICAILLTHGHFDHFEGAHRLQERTHCKVGLGEIDSGFMVSSDWPGGAIEYPHIDFFLEDSREIVIGDHRFLPVFTPGHTPGCMSLIFNCHDGGAEHWVSLWGGAGLPRPTEPAAQRMAHACQFANSAFAFEQVCVQKGCDVVLGVHPHRCDLFPKLQRLCERAPGEPNPFIVGAQGVRDNLHLRGTEALALAQTLLDEMK